MRNFKKIALSLLVVGLAIGTQAFKNAENRLADGDVYVQTSTDTYIKLSDPNDFNPSFCENDSDRPCAYQQSQEDSTEYGATLSYDAISVSPSFDQIGNKEGIYVPVP